MKKILYCLKLFCFSLTGVSQTVETEYLMNNMSEIKLDSNENFSLLDEEFYAHQLFLFGENHGSSLPHQFDVTFFKHLYFKENIRIYVAEVDCIKALLLNNYMKDGNEQWLEKVFKSWKREDAQWANKAHWNKYKELYLFYQTLPADNKFNIVGIDVIQDYSLVREYFKLLFFNKTSGITKVNKFLSIADTIQYANRRILGQLAREIDLELNTEKQYSEELQQNYTAFTLFIKNVSCVGNGMTRDSIMFKTFNEIVRGNNWSDRKMYGFLGFFHTLQCKYEALPFAGYLKRYTPELKIVSLQMLALNSSVLLPYNDQLKKMMPASFINDLRKKYPEFPISEKYIPYTLSNNDMMMRVEGIEDLMHLTNEKATYIVKLNSANSPYGKCRKLAQVSGFQTLKMSGEVSVTTDALQYIVLFRNSTAALPLD